MREELEKIKKEFNGKLVGSVRMQRIVCEAVLTFPQELRLFVTKNCWFISSFDDAWGFTLRGDEIGNKWLIFLGEELLLEKPKQQYYTIVHEVGHVMLKHKNSIFKKQTEKEIKSQERQAHQFALKLMSNKDNHE